MDVAEGAHGDADEKPAAPFPVGDARTLRTVAGLSAAGLVAPEGRDELEKVAARYAVSITPVMLERIRDGDEDGGVHRQFVPTADELAVDPAETTDPISDGPFTPVRGIVHRYPDRVLLKPLLVCPVYCRFCFRRESVGQGESVLPHRDLERAFGYIQDHREIWEVILSGGDPLLLSDRRLSHILERLDAIEHVRVVRIHTRVPAVDPARISDALCDLLDRGTPVWLVVHINSAHELGAEAAAALRRLSRAGIPLLSQSVLLRGVNDSTEQLETLLRTLVRNRIKPYYLHHADLAPGTGHFRTSIQHGQELVAALRGRVSGLCQPTYVLDIPGGHGKVPVGPSYLEGDEHVMTVRDPWGGVHRYPPAQDAARVSARA
ncbi:lysine-2,3-aminomutase-like protein [Frankia sp. CH37]|nr:MULTISPECIES: lysine-2,3-aminomutase-like protein [Parafrankia]MBE3205817.1 lysine-2,3-aminomutase-like protein [Parafrankia sp. CH37]